MEGFPEGVGCAVVSLGEGITGDSEGGRLLLQEGSLGEEEGTCGVLFNSLDLL